MALARTKGSHNSRRKGSRGARCALLSGCENEVEARQPIIVAVGLHHPEVLAETALEILYPKSAAANLPVVLAGAVTQRCSVGTFEVIEHVPRDVETDGSRSELEAKLPVASSDGQIHDRVACDARQL